MGHREVGQLSQAELARLFGKFTGASPEYKTFIGKSKLSRLELPAF